MIVSNDSPPTFPCCRMTPVFSFTNVRPAFSRVHAPSKSTPLSTMACTVFSAADASPASQKALKAASTLVAPRTG